MCVLAFEFGHLVDVEKLEQLVCSGAALPGHLVTTDPKAFPVSNHFLRTGGLGVYVRELPIPKGVFMTGHKHRTDHVCMLLKGKLLLHVDGQTKEILPGACFVAKAGSRKAVEAAEDSIFCTLHATDTTDEAALEAELIEKSEVFLEHEKQKALA